LVEIRQEREEARDDSKIDNNGRELN